MRAFQRAIIGLFFIACLYWLFVDHKHEIQVVYPDNCIFSIDSLFSLDIQKQVREFINQAYKKNKNPDGLLQKIESTFPQVKSIIIDMQNPESLHFTIQSYKPLFIINSEHVICEQEKMFQLSVFAQDALKKLDNIVFDSAPTPKNIHRLIQFFASSPKSIFQDFSVRWVDKHTVWLDQKKDKNFAQDLSLLIGYDTSLDQRDIAMCRDLRGQIPDIPCKDKRGRPYKNNLTWVCDLRFDRQIVLFSTNKGV